MLIGCNLFIAVVSWVKLVGIEFFYNVAEALGLSIIIVRYNGKSFLRKAKHPAF